MSRIMARLKPVKISEKSTNYFLKRFLIAFKKEVLKLNTLKQYQEAYLRKTFPHALIYTK
jgi:hypothetical protein